MKLTIDKERIKLYLWIGVAYFALWLMISLFSSDTLAFKKATNLILLCCYIVTLNFVFFEYVVPLIKMTWKRLLLAPFILFVSSLFYSFGTYFWRTLMVKLQLYFPYQEYTSPMDGAESYTPFSFLSIVFFGVAKYSYDQRKLKAMTQQLLKEKQEAEQNYLESQNQLHTSKIQKEPNEDYIFINVQKKRVRILLEDILYIESQKEYIKIVTHQDEHLTKMSTHQMESILPDHQFHRVHRSFIVSMKKVQSYSTEILEVGNTSIPIGRKYRPSTLDLLE